MVGEMVSPKGHQFEHALDGKEALDLLEKDSKFDIILLDWNMPNLDGVGFLEEALEKKLHLCPIIMMTTENSPEKIMKAIGLGASEYIMKPFTPDILFGKIDQVTKRAS